jgi:hypothetical protein
MTRRVAVLTCVAAVHGASGVAVAEDDGAARAERWQFVVTPYVWATSLSGDALIRGVGAPVDSSFGDILDDLNFAAFVQADLRRDRFGLIGNLQYANLGSEGSVNGNAVETTAETLILDFGGYYRFGPYLVHGIAGVDGVQVTVDPYIGGRFTDLDGEVDIRGRGSFGDDASWVDPILGMRTIWDLDENWNVIVAADVGGFGIGSDLTYSAYGLLGYRFDLLAKNDANVLVGYRILSQDYQAGSFEWDVVQQGPLLGLAVRF